MDFRDLLYDGQALTVEVDVFPTQADRLTAAHPGEEDQVVQVDQPVVGDVSTGRFGPAVAAGAM